jgi:sugar phosphate isomerase/epimerase
MMRHCLGSIIVVLTLVGMVRGQERTSDVPKIDNAALEKLGWKLGCQAYTFRSVSLFETIDILQRLGIHYIEMYPGQKYSKENPVHADHHMSDELINGLQEKLKSAGITAVHYGVVDLPNDEKKSRAVFEFAKKMGLKTIVSEPHEDAIPLVDKLTQEYGINVAIHNHPAPSYYWNCDTELKVLKKSSDRIGSCADVGHWYRSGLVPVECLKKLSGRIICLHFKDIDVIDGKKEDVPWGKGKCDVKGMMQELKKQGAPLVFSVEYESGSGEELIENVSKSIQYFSDVASELAKQ